MILQSIRKNIIFTFWTKINVFVQIIQDKKRKKKITTEKSINLSQLPKKYVSKIYD